MLKQFSSLCSYIESSSSFVILKWRICDAVLFLFFVSFKMLAWFPSVFCVGFSEDELLDCGCFMLHIILMLCNCTIASAWCTVKLRFTKFVCICSSDAVHLRSASAYCELLRLIHEIVHKDELVRRYSSLQYLRLSLKRERLSERERSRGFRELVWNWLGLRESYLWKRLADHEWSR